MVSIYMVVNQENGKLYIGQTVQPLMTRWQNHVRLAQRGEDFYFYRAILKYGAENFSIRQIDCTETKNDANILEKLYIGIFQSYKPEYGYNSTMGGGGAGIPNEQTRLKLRKARQGRKPMLGKKHSEATKAKISIANLNKPSPMLGKKHSSESCANMLAAHQKLIDKGIMVGKNHPMFGTHPSEKTRAKLRASSKRGKPMLGKHHTEETKRYLTQIATGKKHSEATKKKMSDTNKRRWEIRKQIQEVQ